MANRGLGERESSARRRQAALFAAANLQHRLLRCWGAVLPPMALYMVLVAACVRLNFWALLYVMAIGLVSYCYLGASSPFTWKLLRLLIGTALIVQYCALLSLPDSVWPTDADDGGRPWIVWGQGWTWASPGFDPGQPRPAQANFLVKILANFFGLVPLGPKYWLALGPKQVFGTRSETSVWHMVRNDGWH